MTKLDRSQLEQAIVHGYATVRDFQGHEPELVRDLKRKAAVHTRARPVTLAAGDFDREARTITYVANAEIVDRMGDLIIAKPRKALGGQGWLTADYLAAGAPFLWSHMPQIPAVGQVSRPRIQRVPLGAHVPRESSLVKAADGKVWALVEDVTFFESEVNAHAAVAFELVLLMGEKGNAPAVSVGFVLLETATPEDREEREKAGIDPYWGEVMVTQDQLELSLAQTPANPVAVPIQTLRDVQRAHERAADAALRELGQRGVFPRSQIDDFRRTMPLGAIDEAERLASRVRGFAVVGKLLCRDGVCQSLSSPDAQKALRSMAELDKALRRTQATEGDLNVAMERLGIGIDPSPAEVTAGNPEIVEESAAAGDDEGGCGCWLRELDGVSVAVERGNGPIILGVDVGAPGGDRGVIVARRGNEIVGTFVQQHEGEELGPTLAETLDREAVAAALGVPEDVNLLEALQDLVDERDMLRAAAEDEPDPRFWPVDLTAEEIAELEQMVEEVVGGAGRLVERLRARRAQAKKVDPADAGGTLTRDPAGPRLQMLTAGAEATRDLLRGSQGREPGAKRSHAESEDSEPKALEAFSARLRETRQALDEGLHK